MRSESNVSTTQDCVRLSGRIRTYDPLVPKQSDQRIPPTKTQGVHESAESIAPTVALESLPITTFDPLLGRHLELYSVADPAQRAALLAVAEAIVPSSTKSQSFATEGGATQKGLHNGLGS